MSTNNKIYLIKTNIILELLKTYLENKDLSWEDPDFEANFKNVTLHPLVEQDILIIKQQFLDCQNVNQLGDENIASSCLPFNEKRLSGCEEFIAAFDRLKNLLEEAIFKPWLQKSERIRRVTR